MTKRKRNQPGPRPRLTVALNGTTRKTPLHLDHASDVALSYCQEWLRRAGSPKVAASGVVRRALGLYAAHLEAAADQSAEVRHAERDCKARIYTEDEREAAWKRLGELDPGQPMPPIHEVLHGPYSAAQWAAFDDRVEALVQQINREKTQHMNIKRAATRS